MRILGIISVCALAAGAAFAGSVTVGSPSITAAYPFRGCWGVDSVRSQDLVLSTDAVPAGTVVKWEWYASSTVSAGTFNNFSLKLCHTNKTALTTNFTGNYGGNTPVQVYYKSSEYIAATPNTWFGFLFTTGFDYNGKDNLIVEVEWSGDSGGYAYNYWSSATARCTYNYNGGTPYLYNYLHYMRISTGYLGVTPTSLGRVKSLYH